MPTIALQHPYDTLPRGSRAISGFVTGNQYSVDGLGRVIVDTQDAPRMLAAGWLYADLAALPNESTSGVATLDFGSFPGSSTASVTVTASELFDPTAVLQVNVTPTATADHTADEHTADPPRVSAVVSGSTIVITGFPSGRDLPVPPGTPFGNTANSQMPVAQQQLMPVGKWSVAWAFAE